MEKEELIEISNVVNSVFLLDQKVEDKEIVDQLKLVGRILRQNSSKEQQKIFRAWIINILKNRFRDNVKTDINKLLKEASEMEVDNMISNLGRNIEKSFENAEKRGLKQGIEKGIEKVAIKMLKKGLDIKEISELTELTTDEILKLKNKLKINSN